MTTSAGPVGLYFADRELIAMAMEAVGGVS